MTSTSFLQRLFRKSGRAPLLAACALAVPLALLTFPGNGGAATTLADQLRYPRVRKAMESKKDVLSAKLKTAGLALDDLNILIVVYKDTGTLEVHAKGKSKDERRYRLLATYPICYFSGDLGPKRQEGDEQAPEGFYHLSRFNPASSYHLALQVSYPNQSDKILTPKGKRSGGAIMIHGQCVSIGCLAMTDDFIDEIYLLAVHAADNGQTKIPAYVFPFRMTAENMAYYLDGGPLPPPPEGVEAGQRAGWAERMARSLIPVDTWFGERPTQRRPDWLDGDKDHFAGQRDFWNGLKAGYDLFVDSGEELDVTVDREGRYSVRLFPRKSGGSKAAGDAPSKSDSTAAEAANPAASKASKSAGSDPERPAPSRSAGASDSGTKN